MLAVVERDKPHGLLGLPSAPAAPNVALDRHLPLQHTQTLQHYWLIYSTDRQEPIYNRF